MKILLPKEYYSKIMRAIIEFDLIDSGNKMIDSILTLIKTKWKKQFLIF